MGSLCLGLFLMCMKCVLMETLGQSFRGPEAPKERCVLKPKGKKKIRAWMCVNEVMCLVGRLGCKASRDGGM